MSGCDCGRSKARAATAAVVPGYYVGTDSGVNGLQSAVSSSEAKFGITCVRQLCGEADVNCTEEVEDRINSCCEVVADPRLVEAGNSHAVGGRRRHRDALVKRLALLAYRLQMYSNHNNQRQQPHLHVTHHHPHHHHHYRHHNNGGHQHHCHVGNGGGRYV